MTILGTGKFRTSWHEVPAGTRVDVIRSSSNLDGSRVLMIRRQDGGQLPTSYGSDIQAMVDPSFIEMDAA